MYPYIVTSNSIVVTIPGSPPTTVQSTAPNFKALREAVQNRDEKAVLEALNINQTFKKFGNGDFTMENDQACFKGEPLPQAITGRIIQMMAAGEDPTRMFLFWEKLQKNPSWRSVEQLYPFLEHEGIPITETGNFLAYKGVQTNYRDRHSNTIDNSPGANPKVDRNKVSDDPNHPCHFGLHVGALSYARSFAPVVVICEVDPMNVVCIPYDCSQQKMRVCEYKVIGNYSGEVLPSTGFDKNTDEDELDYDDDEYDDELDYGDEDDGEELTIETVAPDEEPESVEVEVSENEDTKPKLKVPAYFKPIHEEPPRGLMDFSLKDLRDYATKVLSITGASKIPGGKVPLVATIVRVRKQYL